MARYIDADILKRNIRVNLMPNVDIDGTVTVENAERFFLNLIDKTSTADVAEVKHGKWYRHNKKEHGDTCYYCSACEKMALSDCLEWELTEFCPRCGADMRGDTDGNLL